MLGYLFGAAVCFLFATMKLPLREKEPDELLLDAEEGLAPPTGSDDLADVPADPGPAGAASPAR